VATRIPARDEANQMTLSFQRTHFPESTCFGCGPSNPQGLRIESFPENDRMVCNWTPRPEHANGVGAICGGVLSSLLDCHAAAAAAHALTSRDGQYTFGVTREFSARFVRPTPMDTIRLIARVVELRRRSASIEASIQSNGSECVLFNGVFVVPE
jgi:uncharacterized protein (TIGR00369 family)